MLPKVAHVIFVDEPLRFAQFEIGEDDLMRIVGEGDPAVAIDTIRLAVYAELMQMQVFPAHRDLYDVVQLGDRRVAGHEQTPPDQRRDGAQRDLELIDRDGRLLRGGAHGFPRSGRSADGRRCATKRTFSCDCLGRVLHDAIPPRSTRSSVPQNWSAKSTYQRHRHSVSSVVHRHRQRHREGSRPC